MPKKQYKILIDEKTRIFVFIETQKGSIIKFVVKLEILIDRNWIEIERYDTYHKYIHKDILGKNREKKRFIKFELLDKKSGINMAY